MQPQNPESAALLGSPDATHLDGLRLASVAVDRDGAVVYLNEAASALFGRSREELTATVLLQTGFRHDERAVAREALGRALGGEAWSGDLAVVTATDELIPVQTTVTPLRRDDEVVGALVIAQETWPERSSRRMNRLGTRLTQLARVAAELVVADDVDAVTKIVVSHAADAVGATIASLSLLVDTDTLALQGLRGGPEGAASRWATFSVHDDIPVSETVRTGKQILLTGLEQIHGRYPDLESADTGERTLLCLPLKVPARTTGAITFSFPGRRRLDAAEMEFLGIVTDICAQALDRIHALAEAADQETKLQFLADASAELAASLDYQATLTKVARLGVPKFADWCSIQLVEDGELRTLAVAHVDPEKVALAEELQRRYPPDRDAPQGAYQVLRTGVSELIPEIPDELLVAATQDEEHLRLARELNLYSAMSIPLKSQDRIFGVIAWVTGAQGRRFTASDLAFGEDLAHRAATAIDNSQLHSETLEAAVRLQQAVLTDALSPLPGWDFAATYSPAGRTEVGGDFYDVIPLENGAVALFVGDVMGRGVAAAAAMAQMRAAVRAYLAIDPAPSTVMDNLDAMFKRYDFTQLVTLVYAVAYPDRDELWTVNAGHPPPVLIRADGTVEQLPSGEGGPLGLANATRTPVVTPLRKDDIVLAFTDGLIERRSEDIDIGQRRVLEHCGVLTRDDMTSGLEELVASVRDHSRDDDVAALAARRTS